jgi:phosphinothricin acetyltransferase
MLPWLAFDSDGAVLGFAYASPHRARAAYRWSVDSSVYVRSGTRHRGIAKALYGALFELLRRQGYVNVYAGITLPNPASVRLHESTGFSLVGTYARVGFKFGRWHDVTMRLTFPTGCDRTSGPNCIL